MGLFGGSKAKITASGKDVKIKHGKTELDTVRDDTLRKAEGLIKAHPAALGKTVETLNGNERCVKVNGTVAFQQGSRRSGELGKSAEPFYDLQVQ